MTINKNKISIDDNYIKEIIKKFPKITSGRKNYIDKYTRIKKNLYLIEKFLQKNI